jgi:subtilase family serine protease
MRALLVVLAIFSALALATSDEDFVRSFIKYKPGYEPGKRRQISRSLASFSGYTPSQVKSYYNFNTSMSAGTGQTIAIINAYNHPTIESDLATFSTHFGLPPCTTANGCFKKVNKNGGTTFVTAPSGQDWSGEITLDVEWVHAIAPGAKILLILADSSSFSDIIPCVDYARNNAQYVSMSFGATESASLYTDYNQYFVKTGVSFFAATGDDGPEVEYPAGAPTVVAVGGTSLTLINNVVIETGWSGSGGGCSAYQTAPSAQSSSSVFSGVSCTKRKVPDVSSLADPNTGVLVYNSYYSTNCTSSSCWYIIGGTSLATPITAASSAVVGSVVDLSYVYGNKMTFRDITSGSASSAQGTNTAVAGYDFVTGLGSWIQPGLAPNTTNGPTPTPTSSTTTTTTTKSPTTLTNTTTTTTVTTTVTPSSTPYDPLKEIIKILGGNATSTRVDMILFALCLGLMLLFV